MPLRSDIKKVLVIGSGPIVIGQAAEFDYAGTQACLGGGMFTPDELTKYFQELRETIQFKKWFFGHYHDNKNVNAEEILLYEQIIRIA